MNFFDVTIILPDILSKSDTITMYHVRTSLILANLDLPRGFALNKLQTFGRVWLVDSALYIYIIFWNCTTNFRCELCRSSRLSFSLQHSSVGLHPVYNITSLLCSLKKNLELITCKIGEHTQQPIRHKSLFPTCEFDSLTKLYLLTIACLESFISLSV